MKQKRTYKQARITDLDYNSIVDLMDSFKTYGAYPKRLRIYSSDASTLSALLNAWYKNKFSSLEVKRESGNKAFVRLYFGSSSAKNSFLATLRDIKAKGRIVSYSGNIGITENGSKVTLTGTPGNVSTNKSSGGSLVDSGDYSAVSSNTTIIIVIIGIAVAIYFLTRKKKF